MNLDNINKVLFERIRQVRKGYSKEHDLTYKNDELVRAAIVYLTAAINNGTCRKSVVDSNWLFPAESYHYEGRESSIIKAAAFLVAELDRLAALPEEEKPAEKTRTKKEKKN